MSGALSDERTGLSFARVTVSSSKFLSVCTVYILHVIKRMYICIYVCRSMYKCMYIQYKQGICQSRLSTANQALFLIEPIPATVCRFIDSARTQQKTQLLLSKKLVYPSVA
jgi:hypothetical protein